MATINDVAAAAQVSIKTVSRVLNGEPHVRPELEARVRRAVEALSYRPNQSARRLAGGRSSLIAYLYNNPTPSYIALIQSGAAKRCRDLGYHLVVEPIELGGTERFKAIERLASTLHPDGVFLIPPLSDDPELLAELARLKLRTVRIAGTLEFEGWNILTPELDGGKIVTEHLLGLGHRRIAVIGPPSSHMRATARVEGFRQAMADADVAVDPELVAVGDFEFASGVRAANKFLDDANPPTAIIASNDEMALGAMSAVRERGLSIPDDISVAGFDDTPASASSWPPLTTVRQPLETMGCLVIDHFASDQGEPQSLDLTLVIRGSTAPPRS